MMSSIGGIDGERLRSLIERIERLSEERKALGGDIKEVYAEAKGAGFDTKVMRQLIKERGMEKDDLDEAQAILDLYRKTLGGWDRTPLGEFSEAAE